MFEDLGNLRTGVGTLANSLIPYSFLETGTQKMLTSLVVLLLVICAAQIGLVTGFVATSKRLLRRLISPSTTSIRYSDDNVFGEKKSRPLADPSLIDMEDLREIYGKLSSAIQSEKAEESLQVVSQHMGFLFSRNVPK